MSYVCVPTGKSKIRKPNFVKRYSKIITQELFQYILNTSRTFFDFSSEIIVRHTYPGNAFTNTYTSSCKLSVLFLLIQRGVQMERQVPIAVPYT